MVTPTTRTIKTEYARAFNPTTSTHCTDDVHMNRLFLKSMERYFNDMLKVRGNVFLNEVYDALGFPRTQAGAIVGWIEGSHISFDIESNNPLTLDKFFFILDFNVDGPIYDRLP